MASVLLAFAMPDNIDYLSLVDIESTLSTIGICASAAENGCRPVAV
jgi:hypothetical protein